MILTPIPPEQLEGALDRFAAQLSEPGARAAFARIRATAPERAAGAPAERHRLAALAFARRHGVPVHPPDARAAFNWDGTALDGDTEAYVILHEVAHFALAPPERRSLVDFGLGPGPDTRDRAAAERASHCRSSNAKSKRPRPRCSGSCGRRRWASRRSPRFLIRTGSKG